MEEKFLIDTNIIIYFLDGEIPENQQEKIREILKTSFNISTISNIEVLGWHKITKEMKIKLEEFLSHAEIIYLDKIIERKSIEIKRSHNTETPDCIIGATAIVNNLTLVTRNEDDFKNIKELKIYNPFNLSKNKAGNR